MTSSAAAPSTALPALTRSRSFVNSLEDWSSKRGSKRIVRALAVVVVLQLALLVGQLGLVRRPSSRAPVTPPADDASDAVAPDGAATRQRRNVTLARRMSKEESRWVSPLHEGTPRVKKEMLPNLVLMIADDLGYEDLGSYGATTGLTPHTDSLARGGVRFAEAHTPSPLCTPSRYSLMTGRYSSCFFAQREQREQRLTRQISLGGTMGESPALASIEFNINLCSGTAERAQQMGADPPLPLNGSDAAPPPELGDGAAVAAATTATTAASTAASTAATAAGGAGPGARTLLGAATPASGAAAAAPAPSQVQQSAVTVAMLLQQRGYATGFVGKWHLGYPPTSVTAAQRKQVVGSGASGWKAVKEDVLREYRGVQAHVRRGGFDFAERVYVNNLYPEQHLLPAEMLHHNTEWVADGAAKFISMPRRNAFFLHLAWTLPHNPDATDSINADPRYTPGGLWALNRTAVVANREAVRALANTSAGASSGGTGAPRERAPRLGHRHYPLALAWMDSGVGMVMAALRSSGHEQNTMVVFTSDHHSYDKRHCYTEGSKVPLIVSWPARLPPRAEPLRALVSHLDLVPTMLDAANVPPTMRTLEAAAAAAAAAEQAEQAEPLASASERAVNGVQSGASARLAGTSLASLLAQAVVRGVGETEVHSHLYCEVGQMRAVFSDSWRLIYAPQIKPIAKGGSTDPKTNYQVNKHHKSYWKPLQLYDLRADPTEQVNLIDEAAHAAQLAKLRSLLQRHMSDACRLEAEWEV